MKKYCLIGVSLQHSFSEAFFTEFFSRKNIDAAYRTLELSSVEEFTQLHDYSGINVTTPFKESIIPFLDDLSEEARAIGAVNVVAYKNGRKIGHNTDAFGFRQSIKPFLTNRHERAIIFGTGGAAKAVNFVLSSLGVDVIFISRKSDEENHFLYSEVNENMIKGRKLLVNCTPVGTFPDSDTCIDLPYEYLTKDHLVIDLIYNPEKTKFLQNAARFGAHILNGESMLKEQALKSWEIWSRSEI